MAEDLKALKKDLRAVVKQIENRRPDRKEKIRSEIGTLTELLNRAQNAKLEAMEYSKNDKALIVTKLKGMSDLLETTEQESEAKDAVIVSLNAQVQDLKRANAELSTRVIREREAFQKIAVEDRLRYGAKLRNLTKALNHDSVEM